MTETAKSEAGELTRRSILVMGVQLWRVDPTYVTARRIAQELDLTHGAVLYHFAHGQQRMRDAIAFHAVETGDSRVIASLIAMNHKAVSHMDNATRLEHLRVVAAGG